MDSALIPKGVKRCPIWQFVLWIGANGAVLAWGGFAMLLIYIKGLNQTNMNNAYGFALWIWADLAVIALGGGAFFTGFLRYIVGKGEITLAGMVYLLACQCSFDADRSGVLPLCLLDCSDY